MLEHEEDKPVVVNGQRVIDTTILPIVPAEAAVDFCEDTAEQAEPEQFTVGEAHVQSTLNFCVNVPYCLACGAPHGIIEVRSFTHQKHSGLWTHWYNCPTTGEPAMVHIDVSTHGHRILRPDVLKTVMEAQQTGRFVFGLFWIDSTVDPPQVHRRWYQNDFPIGDIKGCAEWLEQDFMLVNGPPAQKPLPQAPKRKPLLNLLGGVGEN